MLDPISKAGKVSDPINQSPVHQLTKSPNHHLVNDVWIVSEAKRPRSFCHNAGKRGSHSSHRRTVPTLKQQGVNHKGTSESSECEQAQIVLRWAFVGCVRHPVKSHSLVSLLRTDRYLSVPKKSGLQLR